MFPIPVPGSSGGYGDLDLDNNGDLLVVVTNPTRAIVRVSHVTGAQTTVATGIGTAGTLLGIAYRAANDMIYTSSESQIFAVTPTGTVTPFATVSGFNAIAIAPASFGSFGGFLIGATQSGSVVAVNPAGGAVTTITAAAGSASDLAFAPDGTLYLCGGTTVRTVTATGVVTTFASGFGSADGITIAPDGARMFIADSGTDTVRQVTIPGAVVTTVGPADIDSGFFVGGIVAAPGNTLIVMTGEANLTLIAFPY
jgi:sugar lactone lactonase YvrE